MGLTRVFCKVPQRHLKEGHNCVGLINDFFIFLIIKSSRFGYMLSLEAIKVSSLRFFVEFRVATFK